MSSNNETGRLASTDQHLHHSNSSANNLPAKEGSKLHPLLDCAMDLSTNPSPAPSLSEAIVTCDALDGRPASNESAMMQPLLTGTSAERQALEEKENDAVKESSVVSVAAEKIVLHSAAIVNTKLIQPALSSSTSSSSPRIDGSSAAPPTPKASGEVRIKAGNNNLVNSSSVVNPETFNCSKPESNTTKKTTSAAFTAVAEGKAQPIHLKSRALLPTPPGIRHPAGGLANLGSNVPSPFAAIVSSPVQVQRYQQQHLKAEMPQTSNSSPQLLNGSRNADADAQSPILHKEKSIQFFQQNPPPVSGAPAVYPFQMAPMNGLNQTRHRFAFATAAHVFHGLHGGSYGDPRVAGSVHPDSHLQQQQNPSRQAIQTNTSTFVLAIRPSGGSYNLVGYNSNVSGFHQSTSLCRLPPVNSTLPSTSAVSSMVRQPAPPPSFQLDLCIFILTVIWNGSVLGQVRIRPSVNGSDPEFVRRLGRFCFGSPKLLSKSISKVKNYMILYSLDKLLTHFIYLL